MAPVMVAAARSALHLLCRNVCWSSSWESPVVASQEPGERFGSIRPCIRLRLRCAVRAAAYLVVIWTYLNQLVYSRI
jgi:hypothetical protein